MKRLRKKIVKEFLGWYEKGLEQLENEKDKSMSFRYEELYYIWIIPAGKDKCYIALEYKLTRNVKEYKLSNVPLVILRASIRLFQENL